VYGVDKVDLTADMDAADRVWYRNPIILGGGAVVLAAALYLPFL
jgi:SSS family solute:Na+ symporter